MFKPSMFCKVCKTQSIAGMMAGTDVDEIISTAGKQEKRHCTTSRYSVLGSSRKSQLGGVSVVHLVAPSF